MKTYLLILWQKNANVLSYQLTPTVKILKLCRNSTEKLYYGLKTLIVKREIELFREKTILYFTRPCMGKMKSPRINCLV